jgi:hypothetical protein
MVLNQQVVLILISPTRFQAPFSIEELMIRLATLRTHISRPIVVLSLFGLLLSSIPLAPAVQAFGFHELVSERDGGLPGWHPDLGGDDDQPTFRPEPSRRTIASVTEEETTFGSGRTQLDQQVSFFTVVKSVVKKRARAFWAWLDLVR